MCAGTLLMLYNKIGEIFLEFYVTVRHLLHQDFKSGKRHNPIGHTRSEVGFCITKHPL